LTKTKATPLPLLLAEAVNGDGTGAHADEEEERARDRHVAREDLVGGATVAGVAHVPEVFHCHGHDDREGEQKQRAMPRLIAKREREPAEQHHHDRGREKERRRRNVMGGNRLHARVPPPAIGQRLADEEPGEDRAAYERRNVFRERHGRVRSESTYRVYPWQKGVFATGARITLLLPFRPVRRMNFRCPAAGAAGLRG